MRTKKPTQRTKKVNALYEPKDAQEFAESKKSFSIEEIYKQMGLNKGLFVGLFDKQSDSGRSK